MVKKICQVVPLLLLLGCTSSKLPQAPQGYTPVTKEPVYIGSFRMSRDCHSVAIDKQHNVYLCEDTSVVKYDRYGSKMLQFGHAGIRYDDQKNEGAFMYLYDLAVDDAGNIYTLESYKYDNGKEYGNQRIQVFDPYGTPLRDYDYLDAIDCGWFALDKQTYLLGFNNIEVTSDGKMVPARMLGVKAKVGSKGNTPSSAMYADFTSGSLAIEDLGLVNAYAGWCYEPALDDFWTSCVTVIGDVDFGLVERHTLTYNAGLSLWELKRASSIILTGADIQQVGGVAPLLDVDASPVTLAGIIVSVLKPSQELQMYDPAGNYRYTFGRYGYQTGEVQTVGAVRVDSPVPAEGYPGYIYMVDSGRGLLHKFQMTEM